MASTLWRESDRRAILERFGRLSPTAPARWGQMNAPRMVHVTDTLRMAMGDLPCAMKRGPFWIPGVKQLVMFHLPWRKGVPTAPELLARVPVQWADDIENLRSSLEAFARRSRTGRGRSIARLAASPGPSTDA